MTKVAHDKIYERQKNLQKTKFTYDKAYTTKFMKGRIYA